jgi:hypothetical protein
MNKNERKIIKWKDGINLDLINFDKSIKYHSISMINSSDKCRANEDYIKIWNKYKLYQKMIEINFPEAKFLPY